MELSPEPSTYLLAGLGAAIRVPLQAQSQSSLALNLSKDSSKRMCCNFEMAAELDEGPSHAISSSLIKDCYDEWNLKEAISSTHRPNLPLADHVHRLVTLHGSSRRQNPRNPCLALTRLSMIARWSARGCCSSTGIDGLGDDSGGAVSLPSLCRKWPSHSAVSGLY